MYLCTTTMAASRYRLVDDAEMERLLHAKESKNTRRVMTSAVDSLRHFLLTKGLYQKFESFDIEMLDARLAEFYASVQRGDGTPLKRSYMHTIRYGLKKFISEKMNIDITGPEFVKSVNFFRAVLTDLKRKGFGKIEHHPAIEQQDLRPLYSRTTPVFFILEHHAVFSRKYGLS